MKTIDCIPDEFFKQFKTGEELNSFFREPQKRAVEKMLEGELDAHLDYKKHDSRKETIPALSLKVCKLKNKAWVRFYFFRV